MQKTIWVSIGGPGGTCRQHRNALRPPRRALLFALLFLLALGTLTGCGRAAKNAPEMQDSFVVTFATEPAQPVMGAGNVVLTLRDAAGQPVDDAQVAIEANMSHAGMIPVNAEASGGQGGVYRVPLAWTMLGDWYVDVKFTLPDGQVVSRRFPTTVK